MNIQKILAEIEAEHSDRRERVGGVLLQRNDDDRIAEITKCLGDTWAGDDLRVQMIKVAAAAIEAIEQHDLLEAQRVAFEADVNGCAFNIYVDKVWTEDRGVADKGCVAFHLDRDVDRAVLEAAIAKAAGDDAQLEHYDSSNRRGQWFEVDWDSEYKAGDVIAA